MGRVAASSRTVLIAQMTDIHVGFAPDEEPEELNLTQGATDLFPQPTNVTLSAVPVSGSVPNNPAIEDDQLKVFIKAEVN